MVWGYSSAWGVGVGGTHLHLLEGGATHLQMGPLTCIRGGLHLLEVGGTSSVFSCDQAALQMVFSVCPSVRPSVCHTFLTMFPSSYHHEIFRSYDQCKVHAKGQGQRSKVKVTEVTTQLNRFRTVTPVWNHIWWWNDAYGLMLLRRGALLFLKVIRQISRSHGSKNRRIWPKLGVSGL